MITTIKRILLTTASTAIVLSGLPDLKEKAATRGAGLAAPISAPSQTDIAINDPDRYAWEEFVKVNSPAGNGTNDAVWETWATDGDTFPCEPDPRKTSPCINPADCGPSQTRDPKHSPVWPGSTHRSKPLKTITQQAVLEHTLASGGSSEQGKKESSAQVGLVCRNWTAFNYVVNHDPPLWFIEGQEDAYARDETISFPIDAMEVKGQWGPILPSDKTRYHWTIDDQGRLMGLVALAIMSKRLPHWHWATFEHIDNPGRCDFIGCHDSFGQEPANIPGSYPLYKPYAPGRLTERLMAMFTEAGWPAEWQQQFLNYRLKGTQVDYIDDTGRATLLGNSQMEGGFISTSSCMTCHGRVSIAPVNQAVPGYHPQRLSIFATDGKPSEGNIGAPDPSWYWDGRGYRKFMTLDFSWAFLHANFANPEKWGKTCD